MKRLMAPLAIGICAIALAACAAMSLTLDQVLAAFREQGVSLSEAEDVHPQNVFVQPRNGIEPAVYKTDLGHLLSVYVYESNRGVREGVRDFETHTATASVVAHSRYEIHNVLIFFAAEADADPRVQAAAEQLLGKD